MDIFLLLFPNVDGACPPIAHQAVTSAFPDRHQNGSNALFLDAHVEFRTDNYIVNLVNWDDQLYSDRN